MRDRAHRNGRCVTLSSPRLSVAVKQYFAQEGRQATLSGVGSVAHTEGVSPVVKREHKACGTHTTPVPEQYQIDPEAQTGIAIGDTVVWCQECRVWCFTDGWAIRKVFPGKDRPGVKSYEGTFGIGGKAMTGSK